MNKLNKEIDLSTIYDNKLVQIIINILFSLSTASLTAILIEGKNSSPVMDIVLPMLSFLIMIFSAFKFNLLKKIFSNINKIILFISIILGIYASYQTSNFMFDYSTTFYNILFVIVAIPAIIIFLYWFYSKLWNYSKLFFKSLDKLERNFLIIATCIFSVAIIIIYNVTAVFTKAYVPEENRKYVLTCSEENDETKKKSQEFVEHTFTTARRKFIIYI